MTIRTEMESGLILATDLDGTFAGGTAADRRALQETLRALAGATLIYVTGRSVPATRELMSEAGLPVPDLLIADVGTTVTRGEAFAPLPHIEEELERSWPGADAVHSRLERLVELELQDIPSRRRVGYWLRQGEMEEVLLRASEMLQDVPVDLVGSAGIYVDVLPRGVNKGTTLLRVLRELEREDTEVVVAGDSLNDLAMFETGLCGVVVGNCEPGLLSRLEQRDHLYFAEGEGAAGILEGLRHFGWVERGDFDGQ